MRHHVPSVALAVLGIVGLSGSSSAQGFNVDFEAGFNPLPPTASSYAAAGTAGEWNAIDVSFASPYALVDKTGAASAVTMSLTAGLIFDVSFDNPGMTGEDANLLEDLVYGGSSETITFEGLLNGDYDVYTYAIAPDNKLGLITDVDVIGSPSGLQTVGGLAWSGSHAQGVSYALHSVTVSNGTLAINIAINTGDLSLNGIQIEPVAVGGAAYCFGDGSGATCPCFAAGAPGAGCPNTTGVGARLTATGLSSTLSDTLLLSVVDAPPNKPGLFFQGSSLVQNQVGDGLLCTVPQMRYSVNATDASGTASQSGFGANAMPGQTVNYQYWFRDPANPCGGGFNFTNGWSSTWL